MRTNITGNKIREFNKIVAELSFKSFPENIKAALITRLHKLSYYIEQNSLKKDSCNSTGIFPECNGHLTSLRITIQVIVKKLFRILSLKHD